ncbi:MAG: MFS transporter, partial [Ktedonobacteraceae bacterium]
LLVGLFAGVWVDRLRPRRVLLWTDLGRAVLLALIPVAAVLGLLRMELLYVVAFLAGACTVFFDVAYQSFLPFLVSRKELNKGNSMLETSRTISEMVGPTVGGVLVQVFSAPLAIAGDAFSFLISASFMSFIREPELPSEKRDQPQNIWKEIGEGLLFVLKHPLLRAILCTSGTIVFFSNISFALLILYMSRVLGLSPELLGLVYALYSIGGFLGTLITAPITRRVGIGAAIAGGSFLASSGILCFSLASRPLVVAVPLLMAGYFCLGCGTVIYNINSFSLRQIVTPERLRGRMNASMRFMTWGMIPVSAFLAGGLGGLIGIQPTLMVAGIGCLFSVLWVLFSPVRALKELPVGDVERIATPGEDFSEVSIE